MTHRLLLLRHAKSSWDDASLTDHDRALAKRGRKAAKRMGAYLRERGLQPELVLCSSSRRTRETLERLGLREAEVLIEDRLYGASDEALLARIRGVPASVSSLAVIAHNPGLQDLAIDLVGPDLGEQAARARERFPTGALAVFDVDGAWDELAPNCARLEAFVVPRDLG